jgi:hypothetical protein
VALAGGRIAIRPMAPWSVPGQPATHAVGICRECPAGQSTARRPLSDLSSWACGSGPLCPGLPWLLARSRAMRVRVVSRWVHAAPPPSSPVTGWAMLHAVRGRCLTLPVLQSPARTAGWLHPSPPTPILGLPWGVHRPRPARMPRPRHALTPARMTGWGMLHAANEAMCHRDAVQRACR